MPQYRVHLLGQDGRFINGVVLDCADDDAIEAAKKYVSQILVGCQRAGIAHHRPLDDDEFLAIAFAGGAVASE